MAGLILPALLLGIFYFFLIRPQQRKIKEQKALVERAEAGDRVMLSSGIFGTVTEVVDTAAYVELAEGIEILVSKVFIQEILTHFPTEEAPAIADSGDADDDDDEEFQDVVADLDDDEVDA